MPGEIDVMSQAFRKYEISILEYSNANCMENIFWVIYNYRFKGTTGVLDLYLQHTANVMDYENEC